MACLFSPDSVALCSADKWPYQTYETRQQDTISVLHWREGWACVVQDEIHTTSPSNGSNKPITELTDCYQPSLWHIVKWRLLKRKGREWKEGGGREERGGKGGAARETKALSVTLGTYSCNHGVGMCFDTYVHGKGAHTHTLCNQGGEGACSRKTVVTVTHFSQDPWACCFCMMNTHAIM